MSLLAWILAEGEGAPAGGSMLPFVLLLIFVVFWLVVLRPMKRQEANRQAKLLSTLKKNDRILTIGGIYGTVISVSDTEDEVVIKVDDNTRLKFMKQAVMRNLTNEEDAKKAAAAKPEAKSTAITTTPGSTKPAEAAKAAKK
jgi:preprotein translocase subunit YajC